MTDKKQKIFFAAKGTFDEMCRDILMQVGDEGTILKINVFNAPADNHEYMGNLSLLRKLVAEKFGCNAPLTAYVAQPCVTAGLAAEVTYMPEDESLACEYGDGYILLRGAGFCELISEGVVPSSLSGSIREQSEDIFAKIGRMLSDNGFSTDDIYRQWNYIEQITSMHGGRQNYQEFNDARSRFYGSAQWGSGYPAATGIGTFCGGVMVEFYAVKGARVVNHAIDNPLQTSAHSYSQKVLTGISDEPERTTPKFERARLVGDTVYISGTAAIKGEDSLAIDNAVQQTAETMQIIKCLTSPDNLPVKCEKSTYTLLRVYIKNVSESDGVVAYMNENYPDTPKHYLIADVCRPELLVEIEGTAAV
jgi:enamine deaminase RidA (YjgF/YER057c/UK114 family)